MKNKFILPKQNNLKNRGLILTIVLDGIGISPREEGNAFKQAYTPTLTKLLKNTLYREIFAHGTHVGLPTDDDMGNSEVGHNALGAGNIYPQGAKLVNLAIKQNAIPSNPNWQKAINQVKTKSSKLHFLGLLSDGNVHSHLDHLKYLVENAAKEGVQNIFLHLFLDGRDTEPHSSLNYLADLQAFFARVKEKYQILPQIASFGGRMIIVMDRYEADWSMIEKGWQLIVEGEGEKCWDALEKVKEIKKNDPNLNDQYIPPHIVADPQTNAPLATVDDNDSVVFFNFRGDRAIEMCQALENEKLPTIEKKKHPKIFFVGLLEYDPDKKIPRNFLINPPKIAEVMGQYLVHNKVKLFALSETQKYGHVTYFWNGNRSNKFNESLEDYFEIPSDNVPFDERPWMKSAEIADKTIELIQSEKYQCGRINFPNGDMVGHTGELTATRLSVEAVDWQLARILKALEKVNGVAIILADHGNCEEMYQIDKNQNTKKDDLGNSLKKTSHTTNKVPLFIFDPLYSGEYSWQEVDNPGLSNIASTTLELLNFAPPDTFRPSLLKWNH